MFSPKVLDIKPEDLLRRFTEGVAQVAAISLQIGYPTVASVPHSVVNGFKRLLAVAVATDITFPEAKQVDPLFSRLEFFTLFLERKTQNCLLLTNNYTSAHMLLKFVMLCLHHTHTHN